MITITTTTTITITIYITILNDDDDGRDNIEKSVYRIAEACEVQFQGQQQGKKVKRKQEICQKRTN